MEAQFGIEVTMNGLGYFYRITLLGNACYQIAIAEHILGTIQLITKIICMGKAGFAN